MRWLPPAVAAALGLYQLGQPSLWIDEGYTAEAATTAGYDAALKEIWWFHFALTKSWSLAAGTSEIALRLPSVIATVVAVALMYQLGRRMFDERAALAASLLLAVNPFVVKWSQQARGYAILLALAVGATLLLLRALERDTYVAWAPYGAVLALALHFHPFSAGLLVPVHLVVLWRSRRGLVTLAGVSIVTLPWLLDFATRPDYERPTVWITSPSLRQVGEIGWTLPGAFGIGLALAAVGAYLTPAHRRLLVAWAVMPFAISLAASVYDPVLQDRYLIVCVPAFAILGAVALVELAGRVRIAAAAAVSGTTVVALVLWYAPDSGDNWTGENWREATALVMQDGGAVIVPTYLEPVYRYYGGRVANTGWILERMPPSRRFDERFDEHVVATFGDELRAVHHPLTSATNAGRRSEIDGVSPQT